MFKKIKITGMIIRRLQGCVFLLCVCTITHGASDIKLRHAGHNKIEITDGTGDWFIPEKGGKLKGGYVIRGIGYGKESWVVVEREDLVSGEFLYVTTGGEETRIKKVLGSVGKHSDPDPIVEYPKSFWDSLLSANTDIMAEKLLSETSGDPTFSQIKNLFPPMTKAETFVGMEEFPFEVSVAADGSVGMDAGFYTGFEFGTREISPSIRFMLNNEPVTPEERETTMRRGLIGGYLPATQTLYHMKDQPVGWEQLVFMGRYKQTPMVFIRFRFSNFSGNSQSFSFSIAPPQEGKFEENSKQLYIISPLNGSPDVFDDPQLRAKKAAVLAKKVITVPLYSNIPYADIRSVPEWSFTLNGNSSQDLFICLPGYSETPVYLNADMISDAFYESLREQYESWKRFIDKGAQISLPEPGLEDIFYATLIKTVCAVDGQQVQGGSIHYEGFWPFCVMHQARLMLDAGHPDYARRYMEHFMKTRINPDGTFLFNSRQDRYQVSDIGDFWAVLSKYYWYTNDAGLILENKDLIELTIEYVRLKRTESRKTFPVSDPRHGMVIGSVDNDVKTPDYLYSNNAPIAAGLCDYAEVLTAIAGDHGEMRNEADALKRYADEFFNKLRSDFERYAVEKDQSGKILFWHLYPVIDHELPYACKYQTDSNWIARRRFYTQPRTMATQFLTDEEIEALYNYQSRNDGTVLGVRRWRQGILDDFVSFDCDFQRIRIGRSREYIMKYFAFVRTNCGDGTWSGFEQCQVLPEGDGVKGRQRIRGDEGILNGWEGQHPTVAVAKLAKEFFAFDEPGGGAVWLAGGVSKNWLITGKDIHAGNLPTRYGPLDLSMRYNDYERSLKILITPKTERVIPQIRISVRDPRGLLPVSAECKDKKQSCMLNSDKSQVILGSTNKPVEITIKYR